MECSDHSRYHLLGAEMLKNVNGIVTQLDELAGARTDVATPSAASVAPAGSAPSPSRTGTQNAMTACGTEPRLPAGTICLLGTICNACAEPATYWYTKALTACGTEPRPAPVAW